MFIKKLLNVTSLRWIRCYSVCCWIRSAEVVWMNVTVTLSSGVPVSLCFLSFLSIRDDWLYSLFLRPAAALWERSLTASPDDFTPGASVPHRYPAPFNTAADWLLLCLAFSMTEFKRITSCLWTDSSQAFSDYMWCRRSETHISACKRYHGDVISCERNLHVCVMK